MQLKDIDKTQYRKNLNKIIVGFVSTLLILALVFGQLLILGFSEPEENHFKYNLLGVILSLLACAATLHTMKTKDFFIEVYYVWQIKQIQNSIYRKLKKIKAAAKQSDENALAILAFYYQSLIQVYTLDDNTLTIDKVNKDLADVQETIASKNLTLSTEQFDKSLLASY